MLACTVVSHENFFMRGLVQFLVLTRCICSPPSAASLSPDISSAISDDTGLVTNSDSSDSSSSLPATESVKTQRPVIVPPSPTITDSAIQGDPLKAVDEPSKSPIGAGDPPAPIAASSKDDFTGSDDLAESKADIAANADEQDESPDQSSAVVKQLLKHLFGEAIDSFSTSESVGKMKGTMTIDCSTTAEDSDATFNVVTTLCPFLRSESPCGRIRHPSYEIEDETAVCSADCRPHINNLIRALPNRGSLSQKNEGIIFRDVVNAILHQYCSICRTGCVL